MPKQLFCRSIIDYLVAFLSCFVNDLEEPEEVGACWSCGVGRKPIWSWRHCVTKKARNSLVKKFSTISASISSFKSILFSIIVTFGVRGRDVYSLPFLNLYISDVTSLLPWSSRHVGPNGGCLRCFLGMVRGWAASTRPYPEDVSLAWQICS